MGRRPANAFIDERITSQCQILEQCVECGVHADSPGLIHRSMRRRLATHVLLVLLLVFTQQVGSAHLSAHAASSIAQDQPAEKATLQVCEQCTLFAALGSSPPQPVFHFDIQPARELFLAFSVQSFRSHGQTFYRSRAPPALP